MPREYLTPHFTREELACSHCGEMGWSGEGLIRLERLRGHYNRPMRISSSYRCPLHPIELKKMEPGAHAITEGDNIAVDVLVGGGDALSLLGWAHTLGWGGIGVKQHGRYADRFLHLDRVQSSPHRPRPWIWGYAR